MCDEGKELVEEVEPEDKKQSIPSLADYTEMTKDKTCHWCGGHLGAIEYYPHSGGWLVEGFEKRQWLYRTCMKCGYQWSLVKLGIPR